MTFKVGDKVLFKRNPDFKGEVVKIYDSGILEVYWTNNTTEWQGTASYPETSLELIEPKEAPSGASTKIAADGGPAAYYDLPGNWTTLNDLIEYKSLHQWKEHSFHWGNVVKALTRWGDKDGTTKEYDAKKVIYSGCRVLKAIIGVENLRAYLQKLLDDPQFKGKE